MNENEKIILILGIIIIFILVLNIITFFKKNKSLFNYKKSKKEYDAVIINKRHYTENNRNLYYVRFAFNDREEEYLVNEFIYNSLYINQKGIIILKYDYFEEFK